MRRISSSLALLSVLLASSCLRGGLSAQTPPPAPPVRLSPLQPPSTGTAPAIRTATFDVPPSPPCSVLLGAVASSNGMRTDSAGSGLIVMHNKAVSVVITCYARQGDAGLKRMGLVTSSSDPASASSFRDDLRARLNQAALSQPAAGSGVPLVTSGDAGILVVERFSERKSLADVLHDAEDALRSNFAIGRVPDIQRTPASLAAVNGLAAIAISVNGDPANDEITVVAGSSDEKTARYYCDTVILHLRHPPVPL